MLDTVKVSSRGQIVIPERIRKKLAITEGETLIIKEEQGRLIFEKEASFLKNLQQNEQLQEKKGYLALAEESLKKIWDNEEDEKEWQQY